MVNGFVSALFIKTINCVGKPLDRHLNDVILQYNVNNHILDGTHYICWPIGEFVSAEQVSSEFRTLL